nr:hypothetical protein [Mycoplasmopsis bovis]
MVKPKKKRNQKPDKNQSLAKTSGKIYYLVKIIYREKYNLLNKIKATKKKLKPAKQKSYCYKSSNTKRQGIKIKRLTVRQEKSSNCFCWKIFEKDDNYPIILWRLKQNQVAKPKLSETVKIYYW